MLRKIVGVMAADISNYLTYDRLKNKIYRMGEDCDTSFLFTIISISSNDIEKNTNFLNLPPFLVLLFLPRIASESKSSVYILYNQKYQDKSTINSFFPNSEISFRYYDRTSSIIFLISKVYEYYLNYTINIIHTKSLLTNTEIDNVSNLNLKNNIDIIEAILPNFLEEVDPVDKYGIFYKYDGTTKSEFFNIQDLEKVKKFLFT